MAFCHFVSPVWVFSTLMDGDSEAPIAITERFTLTDSGDNKAYIYRTWTCPLASACTESRPNKPLSLSRV